MSCFAKEEKLLALGTSLTVTGMLALLFTRLPGVGTWLPLTIAVAPVITILSALAKRKQMSELAVALAASLSAFAASPAVVVAASGIVEAVKSGPFSYVIARNLLENLGAAFWYVALAISASMFLATLTAFSSIFGALAVNDVDARLISERASRAAGRETRRVIAGFLLGFSLPFILLTLSPRQAQSGVDEAQLYTYLVLPTALLTSPLSVALSLLVYAALPLPQNGLLLGATLGSAVHTLVLRAFHGKRTAAEGYGGLFQLSLAILVFILVFFTLIGPAFPVYLLLFLAFSLVSGAAATSLEGAGFSLSVAFLILQSQRLTGEVEALFNWEPGVGWLAPLTLLASLAALVRLHLHVSQDKVEECDLGMFIAAAPIVVGLFAAPYYAAKQAWQFPSFRRYEVDMLAVLLPLLISVGGLVAQLLARRGVGSYASFAIAAAPLNPSGMLLAAGLGGYLRSPTSLALIAGVIALKLFLARAKPDAIPSFSGGVSAGAGLALLAAAFSALLK